MSKAMIALVNIGSNIEIEGLRLPNGTFAVSVSQIAALFSSTSSNATKTVKALLGADSSLLQISSELSSKPVNVLSMSQFKVICHHYAAKGNKIACQLLDLPIKAESISSRRILGSIYVLHDAGNHAYKIGFTTTLEKRKRTHKTSNPFLELVMQFDYKRIENEQLLHRQLKKFRMAGTSEWYYAHEDLIPTINLLMSSSS